MTQDIKGQSKADKRAAALRENLKKRKALAKDKQDKQQELKDDQSQSRQ